MFIIYTTKGPLVFLHLPKTGGSSIEVSLRKICYNLKIKYTSTGGYGGTGRDLGHIVLRDFIKFFNLPENCTFFTCVRNPYDRLYSAYQWYSKGNNAHLKLTESFTVFVKNRLINWIPNKVEEIKKGKEVDPAVVHVLPQYAYFSGIKVPQNNILKQEEISNKNSMSHNKLKVLFIQHDLPIDVTETIGTTVYNTYSSVPAEEGSYLKHYDDEMINIINRLYKEDFDMFGYNMIKK